MTLLLVCRLGRVCSRWSWTQSVPQCSYFSVCFLIAKLTVAICATAAPQFRWALMITVGTHDHRGQLPCWEASIGMTSAKLINNNCHARSFYNMFKGNKVHNRNVQPPSFNISLLQTQKPLIFQSFHHHWIAISSSLAFQAATCNWPWRIQLIWCITAPSTTSRSMPPLGRRRRLLRNCAENLGCL